MPFAPLFALDIGTIIQLALLVLFFVGPLVWRLIQMAAGAAVEGGQAAQQSEQRRKEEFRRRLAQQQAQQRAAQARAQQAAAEQRKQDPVDQEIDDFLERVSHARGDAPEASVELALPSSRPAPARNPPAPSRPTPSSPTPSSPTPSPPTLAPPPFRSQAQGCLSPLTHGTGAEPASRFPSSLQPSRLDDGDEPLGYDIVEADAAFDEKLNAKFDHEVGRLADSSDPTDDPETVTDDHFDRRRRGSPIAREIAAMFRDPSDVRKAIIANEILRRPNV